jgi:hypothetical protein
MAQHHFINWRVAKEAAVKRLHLMKRSDRDDVPAIVIGREDNESGRVDYGLLRGYPEIGEFRVSFMMRGDNGWVTLPDKFGTWNLTRADFEYGRAQIIPVWWNRATNVIDNRAEVVELPKAA